LLSYDRRVLESYEHEKELNPKIKNAIWIAVILIIIIALAL